MTMKIPIYHEEIRRNVRKRNMLFKKMRRIYEKRKSLRRKKQIEIKEIRRNVSKYNMLFGK